jgi:hypothetical protein
MLEELTKVLGKPDGLNKRLESRTARIELENWWRGFYREVKPPLDWEDERIPAEASTEVELEETQVFRDPVDPVLEETGSLG